MNDELSSPACYLGEAGSDYLGYAGPEETQKVLAAYRAALLEGAQFLEQGDAASADIGHDWRALAARLPEGTATETTVETTAATAFSLAGQEKALAGMVAFLPRVESDELHAILRDVTSAHRAELQRLAPVRSDTP